MNSTAPPRGWHRWTRELPLLAGVAVGMVILLVLGDAFAPAPDFQGASWDQYREAAHVMGHPEASGWGWPTWRLCLYPLALARLGDAWGYLTAASLISSAAIALMVVGAGVAARALAGPIAGGVAALHLALFPELLRSTVRMDIYPAFGAAFGMAMALGAAAQRWPRAWLALATGLCAGLAWGIDSRGVLALLPCGLMIAAGAWRAGGRRGLLISLLAFGLAAGAGPTAQHLLRSEVQAAEPTPSDAAPPPFHKLYGQLEHSADDIGALPDERGAQALRAACEHGRTAPRSLSGILRLGPCTRALFRRNLAELQRLEHLPPTLLLVLLGALVLLPGQRGSRGALSSALFFGVSAAYAGFMLAAVLMRANDGYFLMFLVPAAALAPVAAHRLGTTVLRGRSWANLGALLVLPLSLALWPGISPRAAVQPHQASRSVDATQWLRQHLAPGDVVLDCAGVSIHARLLPADTRPPSQNRPLDCPAPRPLARAPAGQWLLLRGPAPDELSQRGWTRRARFETDRSDNELSVWEPTPSPHPAGEDTTR